MTSKAKTGMGGTMTGKAVVEGGGDGDGDGSAGRTEDVDESGSVFVWTGRYSWEAGHCTLSPKSANDHLPYSLECPHTFKQSRLAFVTAVLGRATTRLWYVSYG